MKIKNIALLLENIVRKDMEKIKYKINNEIKLI